MWSVVDRNVVMLRIPILVPEGQFKDSLLHVPCDNEKYVVSTQHKMLSTTGRATEGRTHLSVRNLQERLHAVPSVDESPSDVFQFSPQCPDKSRSTLAFCYSPLLLPSST